MKLELEKQVKLKKIKEIETKHIEKSQYEYGIQLIEQQKAAEDAKRAKLKADYLGKGADLAS